MKVLITDGASYIGSHTTVELQNGGHDVVVVDSLINGHAEAVRRVRQMGLAARESCRISGRRGMKNRVLDFCGIQYDVPCAYKHLRKS